MGPTAFFARASLPGAEAAASAPSGSELGLGAAAGDALATDRQVRVRLGEGAILLTQGAKAHPVARLRPLPLPEPAETPAAPPNHIALGLLHAIGGDALVEQWAHLPPLNDLGTERRRALCAALSTDGNGALEPGFQTLFAGIGALTGRCGNDATAPPQASGHGLENPSSLSVTGGYLSYLLHSPKGLVIDWGPLVAGVLGDIAGGSPSRDIAARTYASLSAAIVSVAVGIGACTVGVEGGRRQLPVFGERLRRALAERGMDVYLS